MTGRRKKKTGNDKKDPELEAIEYLKKDIEAELKVKESIRFDNDELEKSVAYLERTVTELEAGNYEADDSEVKQRFDNQRQLNMQLQEQKRWLEHELEQLKIKMQTEKLDPNAFSMDWDNLSETEMKRLVAQLEKTKTDLQLDILDVEYRLDFEGKEYHHHNEFCKLYKAEIASLNRTLDALLRNGLLPPTYIITLPGFGLGSYGSSLASSGAPTPGAQNSLKSPKKGSPTRKSNSPNKISRKQVYGSPKRRLKLANAESSKSQCSEDKNSKEKANGKTSLPKVNFLPDERDSKNHIGSSKKVPRNELDTVDESPTDEADNKF